MFFSKATHPLGLLVMVGRDHRVLVLEVAGQQQQECQQQQQQQLLQQKYRMPSACEWLFASWSSWFQTQPQLMYALSYNLRFAIPKGQQLSFMSEVANALSSLLLLSRPFSCVSS